MPETSNGLTPYDNDSTGSGGSAGANLHVSQVSNPPKDFVLNATAMKKLALLESYKHDSVESIRGR